MKSYYESLVKEFGDLSMVPAIRAGRALTNEDSAIWHALQFSQRPRGEEAGYAAQAVRIMDQGRTLDPFKS